MKKRITLEKLFLKYGREFPCTIWYRNRSTSVSYKSCKHVNWKMVHSVTVLFNQPKIVYQDGEGHSRQGAHYILEN